MTDKSAESDTHPLILRLLDKRERRQWEFATYYRMLTGEKANQSPDSVLIFLGLKDSDLSPVAKEALEALNHEAHASWLRFQWQLTAFTYLQDIFDTPFHDSLDRNPLLLFDQFYFYFESLRLLKESVLCGLNGFSTASTALLRPFLEFSLLQNYFYRTIDSKSSFQELERYFEKGIKPNANTLIRKAIPDDSFAKPIRFRINQHLGGLSESTLHPYHPSFSPVQHNAAVHEHSFESLHFWHTTRFALEAALWLYYANFPMLFSPVDIVRRFGFNAPVGVFVDAFAAHAVENSMSDADQPRFRDYARAQQRTLDCLAFYNNQTVLTDEEIAATWHSDKDGDYPGLETGYALFMGKARATKRAMAHRLAIQYQESRDLPQDLDTLAGWRALSTSSRRK